MPRARAFLVCLGLVALAACSSDDSGSSGGSAETTPRYLFLLYSDAGELQPRADGSYLFRMKSVWETVVGFADRPFRSASSTTLDRWLDGWENNGFDTNPPNAAITMLIEGSVEITDWAIMTLRNPRRGEGDSLEFDATFLQLPEGRPAFFPTVFGSEPKASFLTTQVFVDSTAGTALGAADGFSWNADGVGQTTLTLGLGGVSIPGNDPGRLVLLDADERFCTSLPPGLSLDSSQASCSASCTIGIFPNNTTGAVQIANVPAVTAPATVDLLVSTFENCDGAKPVTLRMPGAITFLGAGVPTPTTGAATPTLPLPTATSPGAPTATQSGGPSGPTPTVTPGGSTPTASPTGGKRRLSFGGTGLDYDPSVRCSLITTWPQPTACNPQGNFQSDATACQTCFDDDLATLSSQLGVEAMTIYQPNYYFLKAAQAQGMKVLLGTFEDVVASLATPATGGLDCTFSSFPSPCGEALADAIIDGACGSHSPWAYDAFCENLCSQTNSCTRADCSCTSCTKDADCAGGETCVGNVCGAACGSGHACSSGKCSQASTCTNADCSCVPCTEDSICAPLGLTCQGGVCGGVCGGESCQLNTYLPPLADFFHDGTIMGVQLGNEVFANNLTLNQVTAAAQTMRNALDKRGLTAMPIVVSVITGNARLHGLCADGKPVAPVDLVAAHPYCAGPGGAGVASKPPQWPFEPPPATPISDAQAAQAAEECAQNVIDTLMANEGKDCGLENTFIGETGYNTGCPGAPGEANHLKVAALFPEKMIAKACAAGVPLFLFEQADVCPGPPGNPAGCLAGCPGAPDTGQGYFGLYHTQNYDVRGAAVPKFTPLPDLGAACPQ